MTRARLCNHGVLGLTLALGLVPGALTSITTARAADPVALKLVDYWGDEPAKTYWRELYTSCGKEVGATVSVESVPGNDLVPKVLQMMASKTLPDVLMFDNPDMQQIAAAGALTPLADFGVDTDGFDQGILAAGTYQGKVYGLAPTVNMIGLFYNKDILAKAGVTPPKTWDELKAAAKKLTTADQYGFAFDADPGLRVGLAVPAVHVVQRRRRDEAERSADGRGAAILGRPRQGRLGVGVRRQLDAGRRQRPVHGRQGGDDDQRPLAVPGAR